MPPGRDLILQPHHGQPADPSTLALSISSHRFDAPDGSPWLVTEPDRPSLWQRGSDENTNGLLRQYFSKGTDLSAHQPDRFSEVAAELDDRPRETLGCIAPPRPLRPLLSDPERPVVATTA